MSITSTPAPILTLRSAEQMRDSARAWIGSGVLLSVSMIVAAYCLRQTLDSLVTIWANSRTYSYGFMIIPLVLLLIWRRKDDLADQSPTFSLVGFVSVLSSLVLWTAGNVADVQVVQHLALIALLDSLIWCFLGTRVARTLIFPLLFLFFAVPVGDSLVPLLQRWTAAFTVNALRLSGIPAVQDGFVLSTPSGEWQVAEACSGIRYLLASLVIGTLVAGIAYRSWTRRIGFLLLSLLLPIGANAVRAYGIVVLAYVSGNAIATGVDHVIYGFVFFSLLTAALVFAAMRSYEPEPLHRQFAPSAQTGTRYSLVKSLTILILVVLLIISAAGFGNFVWDRAPSADFNSMILAPDGWHSLPASLDQDWSPELPAAHSKTAESFTSASDQVSVCFIRYTENRRGVELINSFNLVGDSGTWTLLSNDTREVSVRGKRVSVAEYMIVRGSERRLVWTWYSVGDMLTSNPYQLRIFQAWNRLRATSQGTAVYAVSTPVRTDDATAASTLAEFLK